MMTSNVTNGNCTTILLGQLGSYSQSSLASYSVLLVLKVNQIFIQILLLFSFLSLFFFKKMSAFYMFMAKDITGNKKCSVIKAKRSLTDRKESECLNVGEVSHAID